MQWEKPNPTTLSNVAYTINSTCQSAHSTASICATKTTHGCYWHAGIERNLFSNSFSTKSSKNNTKPLHKLFLLWTTPDRKSSRPENRLDLMLLNSLHGLSALSVQEGNCCTAEGGSYRDGAATEGMALTKPVAPLLVSTTWSSMETHKLKQKFVMLVREKKNQWWYWL